MRQKRYKGKSIWKLFRTRGLPVLVLFAVFSLMYGITVFSFGDGDKYIEFAGEKWNVKEDDSQKLWYTNEDEITFTVDLTEDYEAHKKSGEEPEELPPPFYITAV